MEERGGGGGGGDNHRTIITVEEVEEMKNQITQIPKLLNQSAGRESCCIFRVPESLVEINKKAYHPQIVSIGPYHHGRSHLRMIEEHKWKYLGELLSRTPPDGGVQLDGYLKIVASMEDRIRDSYSEFVGFSSVDLVKMMVLDGLFIIELIAKMAMVAPADPDDPIFNMAWIYPFLARDLLRLENQIPFFVLQTLFEGTRITRTDNRNQSLAKLILRFFNNLVERPDRVLERLENLEGKHLLDFFVLSFIPLPVQPKPRKKATMWKGKNKHSPLLELIHSAKQLDVAGIKFKVKKADTFLEIGFHNGVLEIPQISMDDFIASLFLNSVAFEQCYSHCSKHMTTYATFMGCLINNPEDAGLLGDRKIMENYFGTDKEVAHFFNNLGKDVSFDIEKSYLSKVFEDVNGHYRNCVVVQWAGFKYTYFNTPWSFISALAALILLLLTVVQTFFAVYSYAKGKTG